MHIRLRDEYNGHVIRTAVVEDGAVVARFKGGGDDGEDEAREWAAEEYGMDAAAIQWEK